MRNYWLEFSVGIFIVVALCGLVLLAFKVSGLTNLGDGNTYVLSADFDNIGDLKVRAPVTVSGVKVGAVSDIKLNGDTYRAMVTLLINNHYRNLPADTSASILTQGLLGSNYVSLSPGFENQVLAPGSRIETTHSAIILENLIGQLMFNLTDDKKSNKKRTKTNAS
ncbi:MAG: outer membrane lipid asymmetry maintenance protein MlaD [Gammaproteobacteria bacterium RIFCSPLOWO2_02_FULL_42_14]|nr:MAG: outer membrane lipid asymmetry maintenance protein MlaD [Gammaproteobacteria bacterium RIFCSPHIGHO2_02_FULL_42_43]OGT28054.1 MAG: outer membrane lipid asymmetry maintenance protein MlaD [Gammaproteobacteria bacterium RIFCSPHIGHO2_01_FULL_42_8]OGT51891.1 MAG: outer membrane lipid asymmetry maintenance protein MlaD [Gammaproteobacteria bacterium RIFCSPHIGHO2_12_FULL_41_25]OGT62405.1 MAG: outer membrane lipid asymmetry maintenance protein MlaD [Gammaproteobacteria bacterium RIFCSPLOWO2_02_F